MVGLDMSKRNSRVQKVERRLVRATQAKPESSHRAVYVPLRRKSKAGVAYTHYKKVVDVYGR